MLRRFSVSAAANVLAAAMGLYKQYLIASMLAVESFGVYGTATTWAALMSVLVPFPAYLRLLSRGLSSSSTDVELRRQLQDQSSAEFAATTMLTVLALATVWLGTGGSGTAGYTAIALLLLTLAQYLATTTDILIRMEDHHGRLAALQAMRNVPVTFMLLLVPMSTPATVAMAELASIVCTVLAVRGLKKAPLQWPAWHRVRNAWHVDLGSLPLWSARIFQTLARSSARLAVPLFFSSTDVGLFFFAQIAQAPSSILLSVGSQVFGRTLATAGIGDLPKMLKAQLGYAIPNLTYGLVIVALIPFWDELMRLSPSLAKYDGAENIVLAVVFIGCVQSSDCLEFMLFQGRRSRFLLAYNVAICLMQVAALTFCHLTDISLAHTLFAVGTVTLITTGIATAVVFLSVSTGRWH